MGGKMAYKFEAGPKMSPISLRGGPKNEGTNEEGP